MKNVKESKFLNLVERVQACQKCPRMNGSARVLGLGCGPIDAKVVFIGEAPGRLGADGSHLPFHGDKSGHNFESLIEQVGISRYQVFVTNAVLCNPKDEQGNNSTPTQTEISNCAHFLKEQLGILEPEIVVTLGATALKACAMIEQHSLTLKGHVRTSNNWFGRKLLPTYHPGQRAMMHRSFANQLADYQFIAESTRRGSGAKRSTKSTRPGPRSGTEKLALVAKRLLEKQPNGMSYFALHKMYFLAEVAHMDAASERITNSYVVRQKDGPYCVDLHIAKLPGLIPGLVIERHKGAVWLRLNAQRDLESLDIKPSLSAAELKSIDGVLSRYKGLTDADLKRATYLSKPMRTLLRKERDLRVNLFNAAVLPYQEKMK
ncbi:uracil-DNA glycosylase [Polaromonas sp. CF318]|uniref:uracil-DNA glycosylase n=1 Tax=Polaromonas sp. CF318 TaxID=1144318 RepID=UPI0002713DA5|nr:uracil-DNA glycosylase [Polaromonas sp. CF318]EJL77561.1 uracil-DNA glycosylase [Polaromonas sp. CF318]